MATTVRDVMTTDVREISVDEPIVVAATIMRDHDIGDVLVTGGGELRGILTDRDIVVRAVAEGIDTMQETVDTIFSGQLVAVDPETKVKDAVKLMRDRAIRRLPVVENGRAVGIVSIGDLAIEADGEAALADISAAPPNT